MQILVPSATFSPSAHSQWKRSRKGSISVENSLDNGLTAKNECLARNEFHSSGHPHRNQGITRRIATADILGKRQVDEGVQLWRRRGNESSWS